MLRSTKIVVTLGPATDPEHVLDGIIAAGMDMARINFSHGTDADHRRRIAALRAAAERAGRFIAVLADLPGPKLRALIPSERTLEGGSTACFSLAAAPCLPGDICITEPELLADVKPGHTILLDDGRLILEAAECDGDRLLATVKVGGVLKPNKGVNLPDTPLSIGALTQRDREALAVACECGADWLALSFVRSAAAAEELRTAAAEHGFTGPVMAKIERPEAVARIEDICSAFDGIMVARGDLGVEMLLEVVPSVQKRAILAARRAGKPVITATEMLDSMTVNPRPTRAEASDVANAIFDGTDAVMLSGETAVGQFPVETVACMARIAWHAEAHMRGTQAWTEQAVQVGDVNDSIAQAACELSMEVFASAIVAPSVSGSTAIRLARHRPWACIVAPAHSEAALRRMAVVWGLRPVKMSTLASGQDRLAAAVADAHRAGAVSVGDRVVVLAGHPIEGGPRIPTLRVVRVGEGGTSLEP